MDRLITNTRLSLLVAAVLAATFGIVAWNEPGQTQRGPGHVDSSAWLPTLQHGTVQLVDGTLGSRQGAVSPRTVVVAAPGEDFDVVQYGAHALVINHTDGSVRRVDGAVELASARMQPFGATPSDTEGDPDAALFAELRSDTVWVYSGLARQVVRIDPTTLDVLGDPVAIAGSPESAVVGGDGSLWAYDVDSGAMKVVSATQQVGQQRVQSFDVADAGVVNAVRLIGANPVMINRTDPTLAVYNGVDQLRQRCDLEIQNGETMLIGAGGLSSTVVSVIDGEQARLFLYDVASTTCEFWTVDVGSPGDSIRQPVESDGFVYVPNLTDGRIYVVDLANPSAGAERTDPVLLDVEDVELITEDGGPVYINDPTSARAGVLLEDLGVELLEKFVEGPNGEILVVDPEEEQPEAPEPVTGPEQEAVPDEDPEEPETDPASTDTEEPTTEPTAEPTTPTTPPTPGPTTPPTPEPEEARVRCLQTANTVQPGDEVTYEWEALPLPDSVTSTSVVWSFGDGTPDATGRQVTHSFASPGSYPVTVEVVGDDGITYAAGCDTNVVAGEVPIEVSIVTVNPSPVTDQDVQFQASVNVDDITSWTWTFENGSPGTGDGPTATSSWSEAGTHAVTLVVSDGTRSQTATTTVTVAERPPEPDPLVIDLSGPARTALNATANVSLVTVSGTWSSVAWTVTAPPGGNSPDPSTLVGTTVAFNIDSIGDWLVSATATGDDGQTATATWTVRGFVEPTGFIEAPPAATVGTEVMIRAQINLDPGEFRWNVDGTSYVGEFANPIMHTFTEVGPATISLSFDADGVEYTLPSVTIMVSETTIEVRSYIGNPQSTTEVAIGGDGLTPVFGGTACSAEHPDATSISQDPAPGTIVEIGSEVTFIMNDHSTGWTAPDYAGQTHAPGGAHAGIPFSTQSVAEPSLVGQILGQSITPGTFACQPQAISLVVATAGEAGISCSGGIESASCTTNTQAASIDWGDGTVNGAGSHTYGMAGVYTVSYTDVFGNSAQTQVSVLPAAAFSCSQPNGGMGSNATCSVTNPNPNYTYSWVATPAGEWASRVVTSQGTTWAGSLTFGWSSGTEVAVTVVLTAVAPGGATNQVQSVFQWTGCG